MSPIEDFKTHFKQEKKRFGSCYPLFLLVLALTTFVNTLAILIHVV